MGKLKEIKIEEIEYGFKKVACFHEMSNIGEKGQCIKRKRRLEKGSRNMKMGP